MKIINASITLSLADFQPQDLVSASDSYKNTEMRILYLRQSMMALIMDIVALAPASFDEQGISTYFFAKQAIASKLELYQSELDAVLDNLNSEGN